MISRRAGPFLAVGDLIGLFVQMGCEIRTAEADVPSPEGDSFNCRYLFNPDTGGFQPLLDLTDDQSVSLWEVQGWERRLGVAIPKPA